jgi:hypothetical protein
VNSEADDVSEQRLPRHCACDVLVLGCGNELYGDDGLPA